MRQCGDSLASCLSIALGFLTKAVITQSYVIDIMRRVKIIFVLMYSKGSELRILADRT